MRLRLPPSAVDQRKLSCPNCERVLVYKPTRRKRHAACPACRHKFRLPRNYDRLDAFAIVSVWLAYCTIPAIIGMTYYGLFYDAWFLLGSVAAFHYGIASYAIGDFVKLARENAITQLQYGHRLRVMYRLAQADADTHEIAIVSSDTPCGNDTAVERGRKWAFSPRVDSGRESTVSTS